MGYLLDTNVLFDRSDGYLAATASYHGLTLATRNVKDIEGTGVRWTNPFDWTPPRPLP